jgi:hemoglobin-like flavoprotein
MTPRQIEVLETSLGELRLNPAFAARLFYCRLFSRHPRLRRLFGGAPDMDGARLLWVMNTALASLSDPQRLVGPLTVFAHPSVRETLREADCLGAVGDALNWMLEHYLHAPLNAEVREAWRIAYARFASVVENGLVATAAPPLRALTSP